LFRRVARPSEAPAAEPQSHEIVPFRGEETAVGAPEASVVDAAPPLEPAEAPGGEVEGAKAKQAKHWAKTRKGVLGYLIDKGGSVGMPELHDFSEGRFFIAHAAFSRLMEEYTKERLVDYESDTGTITITAAGRALVTGSASRSGR
jgi:hypothetical protein